jgi:hypothetical protein
MQRTINVALVALMAVLVIVTGVAVWVVLVAGGDLQGGPTPLFFQAARTLAFALGALVLTGALFSIHRRLAAIETKIERR